MKTVVVQGLGFVGLAMSVAVASAKDIIDQYFDNAHIKWVILDFFYPNRKPTNRIRLWLFAERQEMFFRQGKNPHLELIKSSTI